MSIIFRKLAALTAAVLGVSTVFFAGSALAQTGYPPGTSLPTCTVGDINAGSLAVGQTAVFALCGPFAPGASVSVTVDGTAVFSKTPVNGIVTVTVTRTSTTVVAVGDPVNVATVCGSNSVTATGPGSSGATATANGTFVIQCAATTTTTSSGLAFTGANVMLALGVATILIAAGALLVVFQRRRRQTI